MDNEKFQELVLQQLQSINQRIGNLEEGQQSLNNHMDCLEKSQDILASELMAVKTDMRGLKDDVREIKSTVARIENEHGKQLGVLLDGHNQNTEILNRHTEQLDSIESKIENHDIQISVLDQTKSNKRKVK